MPGSRSVLLAAALFSVIAVGSLADPRCAAACSCIPPQPIATYAEDPSTVIMRGTVRNIGQDQQGTFVIERWYQGEAPNSAIVPIRGGNGADCGLFMQPGQQLLVVAYRGEDGVLQPSICAPSGDLTTAEGQALLAETEAAFGLGRSLGAGPVTPEEQPSAGGVDLASVLIVGFVGVVGLVLALGAVVVLRRDRGRPVD